MQHPARRDGLKEGIVGPHSDGAQLAALTKSRVLRVNQFWPILLAG
jgi:hypothetical protein